MKNFFYICAFLFSAFPLFGQATTGYHRVSQVIARSNSGTVALVVPFAKVSVTNTATGIAAVIYSDPLLSSPIASSLVTADLSGNYSYYMPLNTCNTESISAPGQSGIVIPNICGNPASSVLLQTNGTNNGLQNVLNLVAGAGVVLENTGGNVTINAEGGLGVSSINTVQGAFTFTGSGVGCSGTTCTFSAGSGSLPTAASPGQIITSTSAGSTYGVQGQIFYNQTGDTISSIESECSSLCTYVVTVPQTITLSGNHTLNSNVAVRFEHDGIWTVNGGVLTIGSGEFEMITPHQVVATASTGTVAGLLDSFPEYFGGIMSQTDEALRKAVAATGDGSTFRGTIHFRTADYWSDYCAEATNPFSKNYITFAGAGKPMPSLTRNQLIPGSGTILVGCLQPDFSGLSLGLHLSDLGIDRGFTVDATYFAGAQENSFIGTTWSGDLNSPYGDDFQVNNVAAMDYDTAGTRHAFAFEHASNGVIHGLYTYGGNFGVVNKSLNMQGDDIHIEAANTSFIFKSDNTRSFGSWTNFSNIYISDGLLGDGSGDHLGTIGLQVPGNLNNTWTGLNISNANIQGQSDAIEVDGISTGIHLSGVTMDNIGNFCLKSTGGAITDFSLRGFTCTRYNASGGGNPAISLASNFANPILSDGYMSSAANVIAIDNFSANATLSNITVQASGSAGFGIFGETSSFAHVTHFKANGVVAETAGATADIAFDIEALNRTDLNQQTLGNAALLGVGDGAARGWLDYAAADTLSLRSMGSTTGTPGSIVFRNFSSDLSVGGIVLTISPFGNLSGPGTLALTGQINSNTGFEIGGLAPTGHCMVGNGTNYVDSATCGTASAIPFSGVTSGTNTTGLVMGSGGVLSYSGTGLINANELFAVPFCTGYTPTNGQFIQLTTASSPNPCYTATTASGSATVIQVNGTPTSTATPVNLQTSTANTVGLTITPSNPSAGNVKLEITGGAYTGTAANLSGTPALPNGTTATTQTVGDNTTKLATDAFVIANASSSGVSSVTGDATLFSNSASTGAVTLAPRTAATNSALLGPCTGGAGAFSFRGLCSNDILAVGTLGNNISGNAASSTFSSTTESVLPCADTSGSGTAQSCTTTPSFSIVANTCITYTTTTANTGAGLTLNVDSLGAKSVSKWMGSTTTLAANDVLANKSTLACYDGTTWELSDIGNAPSGGSSAFSAVTAGTNTAALVEGTGGSITRSGTGIIDANQVNSATIPASGFYPVTNTSGQFIAQTKVAAMYGWGDSYMVGLGATDTASLGFFGLMSGNTPAPPFNFGIASTPVESHVVKAFANFQPGSFFPNASLEDDQNSGTLDNTCITAGGATATACINNFKLSLNALIAWVTLPFANQATTTSYKFMASVGTGGTWAADTTTIPLFTPTLTTAFGTAMKTTTSSTTRTFSLPLSTVVGVTYATANAGAATFTVSIDGTPQTDLCSGTTTFTNQGCGSSTLLTSPTVARQEFTVSSATHSVVITSTSANSLTIIAVDAVPPAKNPNTGTVVVLSQDTNRVNSTTINTAEQAVIAQFVTDGVPIVYDDLTLLTQNVSASVTTFCPATTLGTHPNDCYHRDIATSIFNTEIAGSAAGAFVFSSNRAAGTASATGQGTAPLAYTLAAGTHAQATHQMNVLNTGAGSILGARMAFFTFGANEIGFGRGQDSSSGFPWSGLNVNSMYNSSGNAGFVTAQEYDGSTAYGETHYTTRWGVAVHTGASYQFGGLSAPFINSNSGAPTFTAGTGAGTSPTITLTRASSLSGIINVTTGSLPTGTNAAVVTVIFNSSAPFQTYQTIPKCFIEPSNLTAGALVGTTTMPMVVDANTTTAQFVLTSGTVGLVAATAYQWLYTCTE